MIYLIGGSPRGGKSILARRLSKQLGISYISTDNLRPVILPYFPKKEQASAFPFEQMFAPDNREEFFKNYTGREMLKADIKEAKVIWPGVKGLIEYLILCRMDYIIEGFHLLPSLVHKFKNKNKLKIVYLIKQDEEKILKGFLKNTNNEDWIASYIDDKDILRKAAKAMSFYEVYFERECKKYKFKMINTEDDFQNSLKNIIKLLIK